MTARWAKSLSLPPSTTSIYKHLSSRNAWIGRFLSSKRNSLQKHCWNFKMCSSSHNDRLLIFLIWEFQHSHAAAVRFSCDMMKNSKDPLAKPFHDLLHAHTHNNFAWKKIYFIHRAKEKFMTEISITFQQKKTLRVVPAVHCIDCMCVA